MKKLFITIALMFLHVGIVNAQSNLTKITQQITKTQIKGHKLKGNATYYGGHYRDTRRTANGDRFNKHTYTAAHKTLPFGTIVKVTNTMNGKSVTVRINDRGPFGPGKIIDVTPKAARDLGMIRAGVVPCKLEIISMPEPKKKTKH